MSKNLRSAWIMVVGLTVALSTLSFAQEQKVTLPKYDTAKEVHFAKVTVQDVKEVPVSNGERVVLTVKAGDDVLDVYLSPKAYLEMIEAQFAKGDDVELTGAKMTVNDKPIILAREIVKGQNTVVLRDNKGEPAWTWMEKVNKPAEGK